MPFLFCPRLKMGIFYCCIYHLPTRDSFASYPDCAHKLHRQEEGNHSAFAKIGRYLLLGGGLLLKLECSFLSYYLFTARMRSAFCGQGSNGLLVRAIRLLQSIIAACPCGPRHNLGSRGGQYAYNGHVLSCNHCCSDWRTDLATLSSFIGSQGAFQPVSNHSALKRCFYFLSTMRAHYCHRQSRLVKRTLK